MMKNNDFDFIKEKFDNAKVYPSYKLNSQVIEQKINNKSSYNEIKFKKKHNTFKNAAIVIACFVLVFCFGGMAFIYQNIDEDAFKSYEEIYGVVSETTLGENGCGNFPSNFYTTEEVMENRNHIFEDGYAYIHCIGGFDENFDRLDEIYIYSAKDGKVDLINKFSPFDKKYEIVDLYIKDGKLVVTADKDNNSFIKVIDVNDPYNPKVVYEYEQSGECPIIEMKGDIIYIFSRFSIIDDEHIIPTYTVNGKTRKIRANDIYSQGDKEDFYQYVVITAMNIKTGKLTDFPKAILGGDAEKNREGNKIYIGSYAFKEYAEYTQVEMADGKINISKVSRDVITDFKLEKEEIKQVVELNGGYYLMFEDDGSDCENSLYLYKKENDEYKLLDKVEDFNVDDNFIDVAHGGFHGAVDKFYTNGDFVVYYSYDSTIIIIRIKNDKLDFEFRPVDDFNPGVFGTTGQSFIDGDYLYYYRHEIFDSIYEENGCPIHFVSAKFQN